MQHARRMSQQRDRFRQKGNQNGRQHGQPHNGNRPDTYQGGNRNNERPYRDNRDSRYEWRRQPNGNGQTRVAMGDIKEAAVDASSSLSFVTTRTEMSS
mmetsp:Transcript_31563/g.78163  ORF Transcript_31563/g.78163 Transcript_31563/m.78163 type:complete len:98 (+) Transcript_31563:573-866(+)